MKKAVMVCVLLAMMCAAGCACKCKKTSICPIETPVAKAVK